MILDGHCHVWERWPYEPAPPDVASRSRAEQLLFEMDAAGVERAAIICAAIGENPRNVDYAFECATRRPGRFVVFPDVDCRWSRDYHAPGAARRLAKALERWRFEGFTHYLSEQESGDWLVSEEGREFFALAATHRLIVSLSALPHQMPNVIALAGLIPTTPIICHHFAFLGPRSAATPDSMGLVLGAAAAPNVFIKYSGAGNVAAPDHEFPYRELQSDFDRLADAFGAPRMIWGSDYPVSRRHMTYKQTLSHLVRHGPFRGPSLEAVLSGNLTMLLEGGRDFSQG